MLIFFRFIRIIIGICIISKSIVFAEMCGTMERYYHLEGDRSLQCYQQGIADDPNIRDQYIPDNSMPVKYIRLYIHSFSNSEGLYPSFSEGRGSQTKNRLLRHFFKKLFFLLFFSRGGPPS